MEANTEEAPEHPRNQPDVLKITLEVFIPYNDGTDRGDVGKAEKLIPLNVLNSNSQIKNYFAAMLADVRGLVMQHKARRPRIVLPDNPEVAQ